MTEWRQIHHFKPKEFVKPELLRWEMILKLDQLRNLCGFPLIVTSSYRSPEHNANVGGESDSSHCPAPDGMYSGVDIRTSNIGSAGLHMLLKNSYRLGFNRHGIYFAVDQKGKVYPSHLHLDIEGRLPQQVTWLDKD